MRRCGLANLERIGNSLGFLKGGEDHYQQDHCAGGPDKSTVDLWSDHAPGHGLNGTYSAFLYAGKAVELLSDFGTRAKANASARFFLYLPCESSQLPVPFALLRMILFCSAGRHCGARSTANLPINRGFDHQ